MYQNLYVFLDGLSRSKNSDLPLSSCSISMANGILNLLKFSALGKMKSLIALVHMIETLLST